MYHSGQALQGQPWESRGLGFGGHLAAPRSQDQEEVLNRVGGDGEKAILLIIEKKETLSQYYLSVEWSQNIQ